MKCIAKNCRNYPAKRQLGISYHKLPKCKQMQEKWLTSLDVGLKYLIHKRSLVCSAHFEETCFLSRKDVKKRRILKKSAVPTLIFDYDKNCENVDPKDVNISTSKITSKMKTTGLATSEKLKKIDQTSKAKRRKQTATSTEELFKMAPSKLNKEDDEYVIMAKAYAIKLKKMEEQQRLYADRLIHEILFQGQLNRLSGATTVSVHGELSRPSSSQIYSRPSSTQSSYTVQSHERFINIPDISQDEYSNHSDSDTISAV